MVMKRYPHGAAGRVLLHEARAVAAARLDRHLRDRSRLRQRHRLPDHPGSARRCCGSINLGCIDLNQWYARCDDVDRPDYLHFDLDPGAGATSNACCEAALVVREALDALKMPSLVKTTGSKGLHVYVPIVRGPVQKEVWTFAKALAQELAARHPRAHDGRIPRGEAARRAACSSTTTRTRGAGRSRRVYSVRPHPAPTVSTPVTWKEVERGIRIEDFTVKNVPARVAKLGDLWKPLLRAARAV